MCNCYSILECCVMFSGFKLSIRSFNLFIREVIFEIEYPYVIFVTWNGSLYV